MESRYGKQLYTSVTSNVSVVEQQDTDEDTYYKTILCIHALLALKCITLEIIYIVMLFDIVNQILVL